VKDYSPRSNKQTPKVHSHTPLKGGKDPKVDLDNVEDRKSEKPSYRHCNGQRNIDPPTVSLAR
jgi:hypothetical protein